MIFSFQFWGNFSHPVWSVIIRESTGNSHSLIILTNTIDLLHYHTWYLYFTWILHQQDSDLETLLLWGTRETQPWQAQESQHSHRQWQSYHSLLPVLCSLVESVQLKYKRTNYIYQNKSFKIFTNLVQYQSWPQAQHILDLQFWHCHW